jgi:hypothetical protein
MRALVLVLILVSLSELHAQTVPKPLCDGWYCFAVKPNGMTPPIKPDMPILVRLGYQMIDSLARLHDTLPNDADIWGANLGTEEVFRYLRLLYKMNDYDPLLYREYFLYGKNLDTTYRTHPGFIEHVLMHEATARLHKTPPNFLLHSDNILHIHILNKNAWKVDAEILDAIKGAGFVKSLRDTQYNNEHPIVHFKLRESASRCSRNAREPDGYEVYCGNSVGDGSEPPTYGDLQLHEGMDLIVFLEAMDIGHEGNTAWYELQPLQHYEQAGGAYVVKDNTIEDPDHYWSDKDRLSVSEFKEKIKQIASLFDKVH